MHLYSRTFAEVDLTNISLQRLIGRNVNAIADEEPSQMKNQSLQTRSLYNSFSWAEVRTMRKRFLSPHGHGLFFFSLFSVIHGICFEWPKKLSQSGHNAFFQSWKRSETETKADIFRLFWSKQKKRLQSVGPEWNLFLKFKIKSALSVLFSLKYLTSGFVEPLLFYSLLS